MMLQKKATFAFIKYFFKYKQIQKVKTVYIPSSKHTNRMECLVSYFIKRIQYYSFFYTAFQKISSKIPATNTKESRQSSCKSIWYSVRQDLRMHNEAVLC